MDINQYNIRIKHNDYELVPNNFTSYIQKDYKDIFECLMALALLVKEVFLI